MHTQSFDEARRLADEATGPLAHFIRRHLQVMVEQGYVGRTVYERTHRAIDFDRWLETANIPLAAVDERCVTLYHQHRSGPRLRRWQNELRFLRMLLVYLRANGAIPSLPVVSAYPVIDKTIDGFAHHLRHHRGLAAGTIAQYGNYARDFLAERFGAAQVCLAVCVCGLRPGERLERGIERRFSDVIRVVRQGLQSNAQHHFENLSACVARAPKRLDLGAGRPAA